METNISTLSSCCKDSITIEQGLISYEFRKYFTFIVTGVGSLTLSLCGLFTNVVNIFVFNQQGLKDGVTISLCCLAFSDLLVSMATVCMGVCIISDWLQVMSDSIDWTDLMAVAFAWPRAMFVDLSTYTMVFVTVERSLCVIMPHKFKGLVTPSRAITIIICIYIVILSSYAPIFATYGLSWQWNLVTNSSVLTQWFSSNRLDVEIVFHAIIGVTAPILGFFIVIICTYYMTSRLRISAKFRTRMSTRVLTQIRDEISANDTNGNGINIGTAGKGKLTGKDKKVVKMVVVVAVVFILCTIPLVATIMSRRIVVDIRAGGKYENLMWIMFAVVYFSGGINASVNMFLYLATSTKYRTIFYRIFCGAPVRSMETTSTMSTVPEQ